MNNELKVFQLYKSLYDAGIIQQVTEETEELFFKILVQLLKTNRSETN